MSANLSSHIIRSRGAIVCLRIVSSLAWIDSAFIGNDAKLSAFFLSGAGLTKAVTEKFLHFAIAPAITAFLQDVVLPHARTFAVLIAVADLLIGVSLVLGLFTRLGALLAIFRAVSNILVAGGAGPDTVGFNCMLITAAIIIIATHAGRRFGLDRFLLVRFPSSRLLQLVS